MHIQRIISLIFLLTILLCSFSTSQNTLPVDFKKWTQLSQDSLSEYFYPKLLERFLQYDTSLSDQELALLRYGYTLKYEYRPSSQSNIEDTLYDYNKMKAYHKTIERGAAYLLDNPVSLRGNLAMTIAYGRLGQTDNQEKYRTHLLQLTRAILYNGSGSSVESAFVVINISEEYTILNYLGYSFTSQSLITNDNGEAYDQMETVSRQDSTDKRKIIFNVSIPYKYSARIFDK